MSKLLVERKEERKEAQLEFTESLTLVHSRSMS
jgi:hypothetical protein